MPAISLSHSLTSALHRALTVLGGGGGVSALTPP